MAYSKYTKQRIVFHHSQGLKPGEISRILAKEGITAGRRGITKFLVNYRASGSIARKPGSGRPTKVTAEVRAYVEEAMRKDDETTAKELQYQLSTRGYHLSKNTILRCRTSLGWTFRGASYCQMIREANKEKRLRWAQTYVTEASDGFLDVVWTDECTVQLETHRRFCCRKQGEKPRNKPRCAIVQYTSVHTCACLCALRV